MKNLKGTLTDKQKINLLTAALVYNTVILNGVIYFLRRDNKFMLEKQNELWDVIGWALETCDNDDPRIQQWATDIEFDMMTKEHLPELKTKWWRRR